MNDLYLTGKHAADQPARPWFHRLAERIDIGQRKIRGGIRLPTFRLGLATDIATQIDNRNATRLRFGQFLDTEQSFDFRVHTTLLPGFANGC